MCTSIASPASTTSTDDSRADYDLSMGGFQMPVDERRSQYNRAFEVMRRFFYNSDEHHDVKLLPKGKANGVGGRKAALYKQWGSKSQSEQEKLAELAMKSKQLSEDEKKAVNTRYLLQKKKPARNGQQLDTEKDFFQATFGLFTYHADKWVFNRPSWMNLPVAEVTELCKKDIEMRRAWAFICKDMKRFSSCHHNPKYGLHLSCVLTASRPSVC